LGPAAAQEPDGGLLALGKNVYQDACAACHGANLEGQPDWQRRKADGTLPAPPHDDGGHTWHHDMKFLFDYTKFGGAALVPPGIKSAMPAFRELLTDREIRAALAYIESRWSPRVRKLRARRMGR